MARPAPDRPARAVAGEPPPRSPEPAAAPELTVGEAAGLLACVALAAVATASVALAEVGRHDGWLAMGLGVVATALVGTAAWRSCPRPRLRTDRAEAGLLAATAVAGAVLFLPGFPYASADKDPGVYVAHAFAIARQGDVSIPDAVLRHHLPTDLSGGARFPGIWLDADDPGVVTPQFFHLYPATLATAGDLVGRRGVFNLTPLVAIMSLCVWTVAARRVTSTTTAAVFAALLATSMPQVWQAKYPSTEVLAQCFLAGTVLGGVLAVDRRWPGGALGAGLLLGVGFLARPDGFLYIVLAAAVVAVAAAGGHLDRRVALLAAGLAVSLPYAVVNAYVLRTRYAEGNSVPGLPLLAGACATLVLAGAAAHRLVPTARRRWAARVVPAVVAAGSGTTLLLLWHRQTLLGAQHRYAPSLGRTVPTLDEANIHWLSWFLTTPGLVLVWLGLVAAALTRPRVGLYLALLPGVALMPVYLWDARISMRLMWWVRRFVPAVLPAALLLVAVALSWALLRRRWSWRVAGAVATVALVGQFAAQSLPLRDHHEMAGSWESAEATAALAGGHQGVFLFTSSSDIADPRRNVPAVLWLVFDQVASRLPAGAGLADVEAYRDALPGRPVFVVSDGGLPSPLPPSRFRLAGAVTEQLTTWEEAVDHRPDHAVVARRPLVAWRLDG